MQTYLNSSEEKIHSGENQHGKLWEENVRVFVGPANRDINCDQSSFDKDLTSDLAGSQHWCIQLCQFVKMFKDNLTKHSR